MTQFYCSGRLRQKVLWSRSILHHPRAYLSSSNRPRTMRWIFYCQSFHFIIKNLSTFQSTTRFFLFPVSPWPSVLKARLGYNQSKSSALEHANLLPKKRAGKLQWCIMSFIQRRYMTNLNRTLHLQNLHGTCSQIQIICNSNTSWSPFSLMLQMASLHF